MIEICSQEVELNLRSIELSLNWPKRKPKSIIQKWFRVKMTLGRKSVRGDFAMYSSSKPFNKFFRTFMFTRFLKKKYMSNLLLYGILHALFCYCYPSKGLVSGPLFPSNNGCKTSHRRLTPTPSFVISSNEVMVTNIRQILCVLWFAGHHIKYFFFKRRFQRQPS